MSSRASRISVLFAGPVAEPGERAAVIGARRLRSCASRTRLRATRDEHKAGSGHPANEVADHRTAAWLDDDARSGLLRACRTNAQPSVGAVRAHACVADPPGRRSLLDMWRRSLSAAARPGRALAGTAGVLTALSRGVAPRSRRLRRYPADRPLHLRVPPRTRTSGPGRTALTAALRETRSGSASLMPIDRRPCGRAPRFGS